jgi:mannose-6-phosphate isomerase-like protein (cupin superfamily)
MNPAPDGPDPHVHRTLSESFYVLAGTVRLDDGRR